MHTKIASDCRFFQGDRPCRFHEPCPCGHFEGMGFRILIIKLGALGDVVRTVSLLPTLKRIYPKSHITWVTRENGVRILSEHPMIDKLLGYHAESQMILTQQRFDLVLSLDKEAGPAALCNAVKSYEKRGIGLSEWGTPVPINAACEHYFQLGLDDELKFKRNTKSYPQLIHEAVGLEYTREPYRLFYGEEFRKKAERLFEPYIREGQKIVGLNTGSGTTYANKSPKSSQWVELARRLTERNYTVVLLGGPEEARLNEWIASQIGQTVLNSGSGNDEQMFVAIVDQCDGVITGDTLAMHVAIAREVPVVALFGPTCEQEIDMFDHGRKIISPIGCGPCYKRQCDRSPCCMDLIGIAPIMDAVDTIIFERTVAASAAS